MDWFIARIVRVLEVLVLLVKIAGAVLIALLITMAVMWIWERRRGK